MFLIARDGENEPNRDENSAFRGQTRPSHGDPAQDEASVELAIRFSQLRQSSQPLLQASHSAHPRQQDRPYGLSNRAAQTRRFSLILQLLAIISLE